MIETIFILIAVFGFIYLFYKLAIEPGEGSWRDHADLETGEYVTYDLKTGEETRRPLSKKEASNGR